MQRFILSMALAICIVLPFSINAWAGMFSPTNPTSLFSPMNPINPMSPINFMDRHEEKKSKDVVNLDNGKKIRVVKSEDQELWISFEDKLSILRTDLQICKVFWSELNRSQRKYCEEKIDEYFEMIKERDDAYKVKKPEQL